MLLRHLLPAQSKFWTSLTSFLTYFFEFLAFILLCYWHAYTRLPSPGYAVAVAGVLGASFGVVEGLPKWHKFFLVLLVMLFTKLEFRAIAKDHWDSSQTALLERSKQDAAFRKILDEEHRGFENTQRKLLAISLLDQKTFERATETIGGVTGGETFLTLDYQPGSPGDLPFKKHGVDPLYNVHADVSFSQPVSGSPEYEYSLTTTFLWIPGKDFPLGYDNTIVQSIPVSDLTRDHKNFQLGAVEQMVADFNARNGEWVEYLWMYKPAEKPSIWLTAMRVYRVIGERRNLQLIWKSTDPKFPVDRLIDDPMNTHDHQKCMKHRKIDTAFCQDLMGSSWKALRP